MARVVGSIEVNAPVWCRIKVKTPRREFRGTLPRGLHTVYIGFDIKGEELQMMGCRGAWKNILGGLVKIPDTPCRRCSLFDH